MKKKQATYLSTGFIVVILLLILGAPSLFTGKKEEADKSPVKRILPFAYQFEGKRGMELSEISTLDYDKDNDLDMFITNGRGYPNALLENDGSANFRDVSQETGLDHLGGTSSIVADFDGDGNQDIFVGWEGYDLLHWNEGDGTFTTVRFGEGSTVSSAICDVNNDGNIDIYVGKEQIEGREGLDNDLYLNSGGREFVEVAEDIGVSQAATKPIENVFPHNPWWVACFDYDNDSDQDLLAGVDFAGITLFRNELDESGSLSFVNVTSEAGLGASGNWMGVAIVDYDGDGHKDIFSTNWGNSPSYPKSDKLDKLTHALYRNGGDGTFTDVAVDAKVADWQFGWDATAVDWDADGDLDIYYAGGLFKRAEDNYGHLFINEGDLRFSESLNSRGYGLLNEVNNMLGEARGIAAGDFNNDGYSDVVVSNITLLRGNSDQNDPGLAVLFLNPGK